MNDVFGDRMKGYENVERRYLTKRMPTILRLDMCHAHTYTRWLNKPYDLVFCRCMWITATALCQTIEGAQLAYVQSDEISILLNDYTKLETQPWFGKNLQKMVSVSASIASAYFNDCAANIISSIMPVAFFDSRAFTLPKEEVNNYFWWRQTDCLRNSIQLVGRNKFSHKELQNKSCADIKKMYSDVTDSTIENDYPNFFLRGVTVTKNECTENGIVRSKWETNMDIPLFNEDKNYVERFV